MHLLRTPSGQAFLCSVPVAATTVPPPKQHDLVAQQEERSKELDRGISLIENMRNANCLDLRQGWFTYSFWYVALLALCCVPTTDASTATDKISGNSTKFA